MTGGNTALLSLNAGRCASPGNATKSAFGINALADFACAKTGSASPQ
jgi:hypothetical protein